VERQRLTRAAARLALLDGADGMPADIAVRTAGTQWIASLRKTIRTHDDCDGLHDELARAVRGRGQRGAIWHACAPGTIDCEAFAFLPAPIAPTRGIAVRQLPAQRVAALIYRGDSDYLPAYRALRAWIGRSGLSIAGPKRELFLRGPAPVTEIQFPIARLHRARGAP
jgi:hypothetical protein